MAIAKQLPLIPSPSRTPAPGPLRLVQQFVNTADIYSKQEDLPDPAALKTWLAEHDLLDAKASVSAAEFRRAIEVREALRNVLGAHSGFEAKESSMGVLNEAAHRSKHVLQFGVDAQANLASGASGVDAAIGVILAAVHDAMIAGTWERLKVCHDERCLWAFYDASKNRSSRWCSMAVCGNRAKARKHRELAKT